MQVLPPPACAHGHAPQPVHHHLGLPPVDTNTGVSQGQSAPRPSPPHIRPFMSEKWFCDHSPFNSESDGARRRLPYWPCHLGWPC